MTQELPHADVNEEIKRILITGGAGQLGRALQQELENTYTVVEADLPDFDVTDRRALSEKFADHNPHLVIHCAAYTDVDGCARNPGLAYRVNALGAHNVALACLAYRIPMVHISTNEVFSGQDRSGYEEWMPLSPANPYGRSKAAAEFFVRSVLPWHYIVRLAWLFAPGGRNFVHAILRKAQAEGAVRVVTDEVGNPTYAPDVARAITALVQTRQYGTYHLVNEGACSRWAFANEIFRLAGLEHVSNVPILSRQFNRASTPPPYGVLHNRAGAALGIKLRPWQEALADFLVSQPLGDGLH